MRCRGHRRAEDRKRPPRALRYMLRGGRTPTGIDAVAWAGEVSARGVGEILLTSMDRDGTKSGFDLDPDKGGRGDGRHSGDRVRRLRRA